MKHFLAIGLCAITMVGSTPADAGQGIIERACRQSNRPAATSKLCRCVQKVANHSLSMLERRKVAKWFKDPHLAQEVRQSDKSRDELLWKRYKAFGERARKKCG